MDAQITVFRSADPSAQEDAEEIREMLAEDGVDAALLDDNVPGVPSGAWEVRVPPALRAHAERLIADFLAEDAAAGVNPSEDLDPVTVFRGADGASSEMEAFAVQSLLESNGIEAILVGDARFPNLGGEVRVPREHEHRALELIREALEAGPAGAEEAEASGEQS